jgi:hypothetical protein
MAPLDEVLLWRMVELARHDHGAYKRELMTMSEETLRRYVQAYRAHAATFSYDPDDPTYYVGDHFLADWVVGQGRDYYEHVAKNRDKVPEDAAGDDPAFGYLRRGQQGVHRSLRRLRAG